jgi:hypothetical protein
MDRFDVHPRGSWSTGLAGKRNSNFVTSVGKSAIARNDAGGPHHVHHSGDETEQKEHDQTERRGRQQAVEPPANHSPDNNARDQLRGEAETARHCGSSGRAISAFATGLVSPDFPVVANFGQPSIETSEPCGKRSFVRRFTATSTSAVVRAFRHFGDPTDVVGKWKLRPVALESRADHTDGLQPSQDCVLFPYLIDLLKISIDFRCRARTVAAVQRRASMAVDLAAASRVCWDRRKALGV